MTSKQFTTLVNDPTSANMPGMQLLEDVVSRYPYFQSGQLLLACKFYTEENPAYPGQLKKAAAYAGDRRILRDLIGHAKKSGSPAVVPAGRVIRMEPEIPDTESIPVIHERMTQEELLAIVKKRLAEIDAEKKRELIIPGFLQSANDNVQPESLNLEPVQALSKASLIEKFILEEPRISKPKATFFNPTDSSIRSNFDEEEIVSETLAQLYAQQGNIQKALHIYEKLTLLNQEKSRYFAAQIEKLGS